MDKPIRAVIAHLWNIYALNDYNIMEAVKADPLAIQQICGDAAEIIEHLCNTRTAPANPPLTLDELREMDGEPVWCESVNSSTRPNQWCICHDDYCGNGEWDMFFEDYGDAWLAYRHKPEREDNK